LRREKNPQTGLREGSARILEVCTGSARKAIDAFLAIQSARLTDGFGRAGADTDHAGFVRVKS